MPFNRPDSMTEEDAKVLYAAQNMFGTLAQLISTRDHQDLLYSDTFSNDLGNYMFVMFARKPGIRHPHLELGEEILQDIIEVMNECFIDPSFYKHIHHHATILRESREQSEGN